MMIKYRVHDVAKDLDVPNKEVLDILGKYVKEPKKHMTALEENELDIVFDRFTQDHAAQNFDAYFATRNAAKTEEKPAEKTAEKPSEKTAKNTQEPKKQNVNNNNNRNKNNTKETKTSVPSNVFCVLFRSDPFCVLFCLDGTEVNPTFVVSLAPVTLVFAPACSLRVPGVSLFISITPGLFTVSTFCNTFYVHS